MLLLLGAVSAVQVAVQVRGKDGGGGWVGRDEAAAE